MGNVSYSAHISNGKSAITSKSKLQGVANHNLRKYKSSDYSSENIMLLVGTENLYQDIPVWSGTKKGLSKKVSKRNVFTPESLSAVLQDKLREEARSCFKFNIHETIGDKKKGKNHDLSVAEYKVQQELQNLHEVKSELTDKKKMAETLDTQLETKKLVLDITEEELKQKSAFIELLDVVKQMIQSYLPIQPDIEEFANSVERGESITGGNSFRNFRSALGQLLLAFKEIVQEGFCWFPRLMRWNTSRGEVAPVFRDDPEGYSYKIEAFRNINTKDIYRVEDLKDEICSENRIGTLEQIQGSVEMLERQIEKSDRGLRR